MKTKDITVSINADPSPAREELGRLRKAIAEAVANRYDCYLVLTHAPALHCGCRTGYWTQAVRRTLDGTESPSCWAALGMRVASADCAREQLRSWTEDADPGDEDGE